MPYWSEPNSRFTAAILEQGGMRDWVILDSANRDKVWRSYGIEDGHKQMTHEYCDMLNAGNGRHKYDDFGWQDLQA